MLGYKFIEQDVEIVHKIFQRKGNSKTSTCVFSYQNDIDLIPFGAPKLRKTQTKHQSKQRLAKRNFERGKKKILTFQILRLYWSIEVVKYDVLPDWQEVIQGSRHVDLILLNLMENLFTELCRKYICMFLLCYAKLKFPRWECRRLNLVLLLQ